MSFHQMHSSFLSPFLFFPWDLSVLRVRPVWILLVLTFLFPMPSNFILLQVFLQGPCLSGLWEVWEGGCHERGMLGSQWAHCSMARAGGRDEVWRLEQTHWLLLPGLMRRWWCLRGQWIQEPCFLASSTMREALCQHTCLLTLMTVVNPGALATEMYCLITQEAEKPPGVSRPCLAHMHRKACVPGLFQLLEGPWFIAAKLKFWCGHFIFFPIHTGQPFSK